MTLTRRHGLLALGAAGAGLLARPTVLRAQLRTLADTLASDTRFSRFLDIIVRDSLTEDFRQATPITVFAPVDQAFLGAPAGILQEMLGFNEPGNNRSDVERRRVTALIQYHMVPGAFTPEQLAGADRRLRTLNGGDIQLSGSGSNFTVQNPAPSAQLGATGAAGAQFSARPARVLGTPIAASNGVIYPIDQVLFP